VLSRLLSGGLGGGVENGSICLFADNSFQVARLALGTSSEMVHLHWKQEYEREGKRKVIIKDKL
jgi:hypothetical protein